MPHWRTVSPQLMATLSIIHNYTNVPKKLSSLIYTKAHPYLPHQNPYMLRRKPLMMSGTWLATLSLSQYLPVTLEFAQRVRLRRSDTDRELRMVSFPNENASMQLRDKIRQLTLWARSSAASLSGLIYDYTCTHMF